MKKAERDEKAGKSVGIWIRVSTEDQAKGESPEHHERRARFYADSKGWAVREVYHLEGVSGKSVFDHPETKRMLADMKRGHITGLIFYKLARLARNTRELLDFADLFREADADLISLQESIDTSTPAGRLFYTMIAAMAQWEREEIAERVAVSVTVRAKLGKPLGGQAPFGYQWLNRALVPHPDEAPVYRRMCELFAEHKRKKTVVRLLNEAGFRTRNGSLWSDTSVLRLLQDPTGKGRHRLNYTRSRGNRKAWDFKPESEWEYVDVEAVVAADLWDRCNAILNEQKGAHKRPARRAVQLFAGIAFCECGQKMYVPSNTPKYVCYKCRNKIPVDDLEAVYVDELKGVFLSKSRLEEELKRSDEAISEKEGLLKVKLQEREKNRQEIDRVYRLYVDEKLNGDQFADFYRPLEERKKQLEDEVPRLQAELDVLKINGVSADEVLAEATDLYSRWPTFERELKRRVVESITDKIVVGRDEVSIHLAHIPSSREELTEKQRNFRDSWRRRA